MTEQEQKAIEILDTFELRRKTKNYNKLDLNDVYASQIALNLISKLQADIDLKDKVIDLMADFIGTNTGGSFDYITEWQGRTVDYFYKKVEKENE